MQHLLGKWPGGRGWLVGLMLVSSRLAGAAADYYVSMEPYGFFKWRFNPSYLEIQVGDTVSWGNEDYSYYYYHDATCYRNGYVFWSTGSIYPGDQSDPMTFPFVDTYSYVDHSFSSYGMTGTLVVNAATPSAPTAGTLVDPAWLSDGRFQCSVSNLVVGRAYIIQASTNLVDWVNVSTNQAASTLETFTDDGAPAFRLRYYRSLHL